jgi:rfaE bifunctional protein nucleotidyltransferase chain/domain
VNRGRQYKPVLLEADWRRGLLLGTVNARRQRGDVIVLANGIFDILHAGHVQLFRYCAGVPGAGYADRGVFVVAALNGDASARRCKGEGRPYLPLEVRLETVASLHEVDIAVGFHEDTPDELVAAVRPDVLVKGAEYLGADVPGASHAQEVQFFSSPVVVHTTDLARMIGKSMTGEGRKTLPAENTHAS